MRSSEVDGEEVAPEPIVDARTRSAFERIDGQGKPGTTTPAS
jgi:hypothetical protein